MEETGLVLALFDPMLLAATALAIVVASLASALRG